MNPLVYKSRVVNFHGTVDVEGYKLKIYSLVSKQFDNSSFPSKEKIKQLLAPGLPNPELDTDHKVGFGILHWANDGLYTLTNTWYDANMLRMKAFKVNDFRLEGPEMISLDHLNVITCVWELEISKYERDAWVRSVLEKEPKVLTDEIINDYTKYGYQGYV